MTTYEAKKIYDYCINKSILTPDDEFLLTEALEFLIEVTQETRWMVSLGGFYYGKRQFDLALKYYEMADTYGDEWAPEGLGYIWYYGRTGERDYEKAFKYYSKAAANGSLTARYKIADMYKNGYYVEKDYDKYCEIIENLYLEVKDGCDFDTKLDILTRLARIRKKQGRIDEAIELYLEAKPDVARRIEFDRFFGDLNVMKWLIEDLYTMTPIDYADFDLYDLYEILKKPIKVSFLYGDDELIVESVQEEGSISIKYQDVWYRDIDDFFRKASVDGHLLLVVFRLLYAYRVV